MELRFDNVSAMEFAVYRIDVFETYQVSEPNMYISALSREILMLLLALSKAGL